MTATSAGDGPGDLLQLIDSGEARTRSALAQVTGLSRSTVTQRLDVLFRAGLVIESTSSQPSGGRPATMLSVDRTSAVVLCVDVGEKRTRFAVTDLDAKILAERVERLDLSEGPDKVLDKISTIVERLAPTPSSVAGVALGLPAPVDHEAGAIHGWSVMAGWEGYELREHLQRRLGVPVLVDNDVNLLTLAEHRRHWPAARHLFYVKAGTGVGSGMVVDGRINRGAQGAAGDIGHAHVPGHGDPVCRCGKPGCLEAIVGGWALARDLRRTGADGHNARDVIRWVRQGNSDALASVRRAGRVLGDAMAYATSLLNPEVIVIGGLLATAGDDLIAGVRGPIYAHALPLATRDLRIVSTGFRSRAGIAGGAYLVRGEVLEAGRINRALAAGKSPFTLRV